MKTITRLYNDPMAVAAPQKSREAINQFIDFKPTRDLEKVFRYHLNSAFTIFRRVIKSSQDVFFNEENNRPDCK